MDTGKHKQLHLQKEEDLVHVRQEVRDLMKALGFQLVAQTKMVTAVSELARNTLNYGRGGTALLDAVQERGRTGLRITFEDHGPGIPDLALAMQDGFSTSGGLGLGMGGAKRLVDVFELESELGQGTRVTIALWL